MSEKEILNKILYHVQRIEIDMAKNTVHQEQHRKEIDAITKRVNNQRDVQNKFFGAISIIGLGLSAFFSWLFKHF